MKSYLAILLIMACASAAWGQVPAKPLPPPGKLLAVAPDYSQWVVTYSYPDERDKTSQVAGTAAPAAASRVKTITTTKTGDIVREEIVTSAGKKYEEWHVGTTQFRKAPDTKVWLQNDLIELTDGRGTTDYSPLPVSGFRDLDWITKDSYAGIIKYGEKNCLIFVLSAPPGLDLSDPRTQEDTIKQLGMIAFVDAESRMPLQVQTNSIIRFYHFNEPPTEKLKLPEDLAQQIKAGKEERERLSAPAGKPY